MAESAVSFLSRNLAKLLSHQASLIAGTKNEMELLKRDLDSLKAFLRDSAKRPYKSEVFRDTERRIREVIYDAENTIDYFMIRAVKESRKNVITRRLIPSFNLAKEVKNLREGHVIKMMEEATALGMGSESSQQHELPPKALKLRIVREHNIVGVEDAKRTILGYLREPMDKTDFISIIGLPGLGKTTLAWKIMKSEYVQREFPNRIWVYVTQTPNVKNVILTILKEFTNEDLSGLTDPVLIRRVQGYLKERKVFLVLDDIWTISDWDDIRGIFSESYPMSKVILTSRVLSVGLKASQHRDPYMLPFLTDEKGWELLQYEVFGELGVCPEDLREVGQRIARNCHELPLSVVVIGRILFDQWMKNDVLSATEDAWVKVSNNVTEFLKNEKQVFDIVGLSYKSLPDELKDCFLYLAVFPEDFQISAWALMRLWIAEEFIQGPCLEEIAEEHLKELINRNLVMVEERNSKGEAKTCRIHNVIHAFCSSKASVKEENLFQELKFSSGTFYPSLSQMDQYHRLCIHSHFENFMDQAESSKASRIRSLLCFNEASSELHERYSRTMIDGYNMLRVLESKSMKLVQLPGKVHKLSHLRYITLSVDTVGSLPRRFSKLLLLQTLVVYTKREFLIIKAKIQSMLHLRHLKTKAVITELAQEEGDGCKTLQTLSRISPEICTTDVFKGTTNLKRLGIQGNLMVLFSTPALENHTQLEELKLVNTAIGATSFPESENWFPPNLKMLTVEGVELDEDCMSTLGKIETLLVLKLKCNTFSGKSWEAVDQGFRALRSLIIDETDLHIWTASSDSFPRLSRLVLKNCNELKDIPDGVVGRLEALEIKHLSSSAVESAKRIDDKKKEGAVRFKLTIGAGCLDTE